MSFKTFDTDNSGEIGMIMIINIFVINNYILFVLDFVEFLIAISVTSHGDIREKLNMAFNMYGKSNEMIIDNLKLFILFFFIDIDKNGRVDAKEMEQIVTVCI